MMYFFHIIEDYFYGSHTYIGVFSIQRATWNSAQAIISYTELLLFCTGINRCYIPLFYYYHYH